MNTELQLIFGLPGETPDSFRSSIDFAASLEPQSIATFILMILPGTELWKKAKHFGIEYQQEPYYHFLRSPTLNDSDREYALEVAHAIGPIYRFGVLKILRKELNIKLTEFLDLWIAYRQKYNLPWLSKMSDTELRKTLYSFIKDLCARFEVSSDFYLLTMKSQFPELKSVAAHSGDSTLALQI